MRLSLLRKEIKAVMVASCCYLWMLLIIDGCGWSKERERESWCRRKERGGYCYRRCWLSVRGVAIARAGEDNVVFGYFMLSLVPRSLKCLFLFF